MPIDVELLIDKEDTVNNKTLFKYVLLLLMMSYKPSRGVFVSAQEIRIQKIYVLSFALQSQMRI